jgi:hypothetical protein
MLNVCDDPPAVGTLAWSVYPFSVVMDIATVVMDIPTVMDIPAVLRHQIDAKVHRR